MTGARPITAGAVASVLLLTACSGAGRPTLSDETLPPRACSADGTVVEVEAEGVPRPIARTRQAVIDAAVHCDYERLENLADRGGLEVLIDGDRVPVATWRAREADGQPILSFLVGILALEAAEEGDGGPGSATWPSAVDWAFADVSPPGARADLVAVVGEDGVFGWAETGGYAGWRTTIGADGEWQSFVHGPRPDR